MTNEYMWKAFTIAAAVAIVVYFVGCIIDAEFTHDMWVTVWGLIILANIYAGRPDNADSDNGNIRKIR